MPDACRKCGLPHPGCTGHRSRRVDGRLQPCKQTRGLVPVTEGQVCYAHGGATPAIQVAAERKSRREDGQRKAAALVEAYIQEHPNADPMLELIRMVLQTAAWERALAMLLYQEDDVIESVDYGVGGSRREENIRYRQWKDAADRLVKFSKVAVDAGVETKQLEMLKEFAATFGGILTAVLGDLGLPAEQQQRGRELYARRLRLVAGGGS